MKANYLTKEKADEVHACWITITLFFPHTLRSFSIISFLHSTSKFKSALGRITIVLHDRIDSKHPCKIGEEMLDKIVSTNPLASQGIGCDNMTIVIIDLLPHSRPFGNQMNAGGFVNQFGRLNGNLNLSRLIGDLKYKQVPGIPPGGTNDYGRA